jgi:hypothetical protein
MLYRSGQAVAVIFVHLDSLKVVDSELRRRGFNDDTILFLEGEGKKRPCIILAVLNNGRRYVLAKCRSKAPGFDVSKFISNERPTWVETDQIHNYPAQLLCETWRGSALPSNGLLPPKVVADLVMKLTATGALSHLHADQIIKTLAQPQHFASGMSKARGTESDPRR